MGNVIGYEYGNTRSIKFSSEMEWIGRSCWILGRGGAELRNLDAGAGMEVGGIVRREAENCRE